MAVETEGNLAVALEYLTRGVDSEGNPIDREGAQKELEDIIRSGGEHPSVRTSFPGSEVYSRTTDQMLARGLSAYDAGIMKTQNDEQQRVFGAVLLTGADNGIEKFPGFGGILDSPTWTSEDALEVDEQLGKWFPNQAFSKTVYINTAENFLTGQIALLSKGGLDAGEADDLRNFVTRIGNGLYKGLALAVDGAPGRDSRTPAKVLGLMLASINRAEESEAASQANRRAGNVEQQRNGEALLTEYHSHGSDWPLIKEALINHPDITSLNDGVITDTTMSLWFNRFKELKDGTAQQDGIDAEALKTEYDAMLREGVPRDIVFGKASDDGFLSSEVGSQWYQDNRSRTKLDKIQNSPSTAGQAIRSLTHVLGPKLDSNKLSPTLVASGKADADRLREEIVQSLAEAMDAKEGLDNPRDLEDFITGWIKEGQEPSGFIDLRIKAFNMEVDDKISEADTLVKDFAKAKKEQNQPEMERLLDAADGILSVSRFDRMALDVQDRKAIDSTIGLVNSETMRKLVDQEINSAITRMAAGDSRVLDRLSALRSRFAQPHEERLGEAARAFALLDPQSKQSQVSLIASELADTLAAEIGVTKSLQSVRDEPSAEEAQVNAFRDAVNEGQRFLARSPSYGLDAVHGELGSNTEAGKDLAHLHTYGHNFFTEGGREAVDAAKNLGNSEVLTVVSSEDRNQLTGALWARSVFPLDAVGSKDQTLTSDLGSLYAPFGSRAYIYQDEYLREVGFPSHSLEFLKDDSQDTDSPEYLNNLSVLESTAVGLGFQVSVKAEPVFNTREVTITTQVDVSDHVHKPMSTAYFTHASELLAPDLDLKIKSAFSEWEWPTEGEEYTKRKELWLAAQKRLITMQEDY